MGLLQKFLGKNPISTCRFEFNFVQWKKEESHEIVACTVFAFTGLRADIQSSRFGGGERTVL
jgi:hypothetical protein